MGFGRLETLYGIEKYRSQATSLKGRNPGLYEQTVRMIVETNPKAASDAARDPDAIVAACLLHGGGSEDALAATVVRHFDPEGVVAQHLAS